MLIIIFFTKLWYAFFKELKKNVRKKMKLCFKHDDHMRNQDCHNPTIVLAICYPEFWKIFPILVRQAYFFSLLKEYLWVYKATNAVRHKIYLLIRKFFCKLTVSADFRGLLLYGKCRHQKIRWKSLHFTDTGIVLINKSLL